MITSGAYSTPNDSLMAVAIRFACLGDQNEKSSGSRAGSPEAAAVEAMPGVDAGTREGSESRQSTIIFRRDSRTDLKSVDVGRSTVNVRKHPR